MLINNTSRCLSGLEYNGTDCLQPPDESQRSAGSLSVTEFWLVVAVFASLYGVVFVVGIVGNSLVIYVVARHRPMQTVTNVFIANLAVSDVIMCLLAVPFTPLSALLHSWTFGETICHLMPMAMGITVYVSTLTSTAISVNRYLSTVHPFPAKFSKVSKILNLSLVGIYAACMIFLVLKFFFHIQHLFIYVHSYTTIVYVCVLLLLLSSHSQLKSQSAVIVG